MKNRTSNFAGKKYSIIGTSTHVASPTKSSALPLSLSIILILSSDTPSDMVNTKCSFHSGSDPFPASEVFNKNYNWYRSIIFVYAYFMLTNQMDKREPTCCNTAFLILSAASEDDIRIHVACPKHQIRPIRKHKDTT